MVVRKIGRMVFNRNRKDPDTKIRAGFIGCGRHAMQNLYPSLRFAPVELISVCALHMCSAMETGKLFGAERFYDNYVEMLDEVELDAVFIAVNPELHSEMIARSLERGLNVFVEKPATMDSEAALRIAEQSEEVGKFVMVGFMKRFAPTYREAKRLIESEEFGFPSYIGTRLCVGNMAERDFLLHVAVHHFDLIRYFMGEVTRLNVEKCTSNGQAIYAVSLRFADDSIGTMYLSSNQSWSKYSERVEVSGQGNFVVIDNVLSLKYYRKTDSPPGIIPDEREYTLSWEPNFTVPNDENQSFFLNGYVYEIRHFVECVKEGKIPDVTILDNYHALRLVEQLCENG